MKPFALLLPVIALCACAAQPKKAPEPAPLKLPVAAATEGEPVTSEKVLALQRDGYKLVNRDGQAYYCRTENKLGSHIARETVCMTEQEIESLRMNTKQRLDEVVRMRPPPQGH